ncbi:hypothetical protein WAB17_11260 [Parerythrobacter aurantius]|uniref:hypothetical protein n=1 Tax=Parerythrobacter aurantius TaxID=3127706 RepID=UPI00325181C3
MDDDEDLARQLQAAIEGSRGYASYWEWAPDRQQQELGVAEALAKYLSFSENAAIEYLSPVESDPPDAVMRLADQRLIGIEVTELVDAKTAEGARYAKSNGGGHVPWASWDSTRLANDLKKRIMDKDAKLAACRDQYDEMMLAIATDEPLITLEIASSAFISLQIEAKNIDRAFLLLSYHPDYNIPEFPGGIPVLEIGIS